MKIKDKNVEKILREIEVLLTKAYQSHNQSTSDRYVIDARSKARVLIELIDWEEEK